MTLDFYKYPLHFQTWENWLTLSHKDIIQIRPKKIKDNKKKTQSTSNLYLRKQERTKCNSEKSIKKLTFIGIEQIGFACTEKCTKLREDWQGKVGRGQDAESIHFHSRDYLRRSDAESSLARASSQWRAAQTPSLQIPPAGGRNCSGICHPSSLLAKWYVPFCVCVGGGGVFVGQQVQSEVQRVERWGWGHRCSD